MPHEPLIKSRSIPPALFALALVATSPATQAADASLGPQLCAVLTTVVPEVQTFDAAWIDRLTIASCRKERDDLLRITRMLSLSEAFGDGW